MRTHTAPSNATNQDLERDFNPTEPMPGPSATEPVIDPIPDAPPVPAPRRAFPRCDVPVLSGSPGLPLDGPTVNTWIDRCEDEFDAYFLIHNISLPDALRILFASMKLEHPCARAWWSERREELKSFGSWTNFASRLRERFVSVNWRLDALARFYAIRQTASFEGFVAELLAARNALSSAGVGYALSDSVVKNHILFFCHPILSLRTRATPAFRYEGFRLEQLVSLMAAMWSSLDAEGLVAPTLRAATRPPPSSRPPVPPSSQLPLPQTSTSTRPPLSVAERESLRAVGGCFHCRRTPSSPGWVAHSAANCPGDPAAGISPRMPRPTPVAAVAAVSAVSAPLHEIPDDLFYYGDANANPSEPVISTYIEGDEYDSFSSSG